MLGAQELPCVCQLAFCSLLIFLCSYDISVLIESNCLGAVAVKLCDTLSIIRYQVGELNNTDKASRELYYHCVQDVIHQAILFFPIYVQHTS